jgi:hypothetical protein
MTFWPDDENGVTSNAGHIEAEYAKNVTETNKWLERDEARLNRLGIPKSD